MLLRQTVQFAFELILLFLSLRQPTEDHTKVRHMCQNYAIVVTLVTDMNHQENQGLKVRQEILYYSFGLVTTSSLK